MTIEITRTNRPAAIDFELEKTEERFKEALLAHVTGETKDGLPIEVTILNQEMDGTNGAFYVHIDGELVYHDYEIREWPGVEARSGDADQRHRRRSLNELGPPGPETDRSRRRRRMTTARELTRNEADQAAGPDGYVLFAYRTPGHRLDPEHETDSQILEHRPYWLGDEEWTRDHLSRLHGWTQERVERFLEDNGPRGMEDEHLTEHGDLEGAVAALDLPVPHIHDDLTAIARVIAKSTLPDDVQDALLTIAARTAP